jgi:thiamine-monophosphate kinase
MKTPEFSLIHKIRQGLMSTHVGLIEGIGDDAAVVEKDGKNVFLISADSVVEGIHFDLRYFSFYGLGKKAMAIALSDIAAMAGTPAYAFVAVGIPPKVQENDVLDFYTGLEHVAQEFQTAIVGGDTSAAPGAFFAAVTVIGEAPRNRVKLRSGARAGDGIYVSGCLGSAAVGLRLLKKKKTAENVYVRSHLNPRPRLALARILSEYEAVHAVIDVSDGLVQDLSHIARASGVGAQIDATIVPTEKDFAQQCRRLKLNPVETALAGGEDYELLFTMEDGAYDSLQKQLAAKKLRVTRIGTVVSEAQAAAGPGDVATHERRVYIYGESGREIKLSRGGHEHFS